MPPPWTLGGTSTAVLEVVATALKEREGVVPGRLSKSPCVTGQPGWK